MVAFPTDEDAKKATKAWAKGTPFKGTVTSMNPKAQKSAQMKRGSEAVLGFAKTVADKKKKKQAAARGKKGAGENAGDRLAGRTGTARIAPPGTEVLLVVAPKQRELMVSGAGRSWAGRNGGALAGAVCVWGFIRMFFALLSCRPSANGTSRRARPPVPS